MRKKLVSFLCITALSALMVACNDSASADSSSVAEGYALENSEENSEAPDTKSQVDHVEEVKSVSIEDTIKSTYPSAKVSTADDSITVDWSDYYEDTEACAKYYIYDCAYIMGTSGFEREYSNISFSYKDDLLMAILTVTDFENISNYNSQLFSAPEDGGANYAAALLLLYDKVFFNHDIKNQQLIEQGKLANEYNIDAGNAALEAKPEDDLWFYSSFDKSVAHELQDASYVLNYRISEDDKAAYGELVGNDINRAAEHLETLIESGKSQLSFDNFLIICFDRDTDDRYFEYRLSKQDDRTWNVTLYNSFNEDFKSGLEKALNEE